tara:strand:+ start:24574 stop:24741 length:168 start_codon:yes stop_codon:yes gene_type:complete
VRWPATGDGPTPAAETGGRVSNNAPAARGHAQVIEVFLIGWWRDWGATFHFVGED